MRVLVAPDSFTGSMTAVAAAHAIADGWRRTAPDDDLELQPLSDGGPGFLAAIRAACGGELISVPATGPWGGPVAAAVLRTDSSGVPTAYIEVAQTAGAPGTGEPGAASSTGVAPVLRAALAGRPLRIVVGLGGSLTTDAGAGMLAGLGATARDGNGREVTGLLSLGGLGLPGVAHVDIAGARTLLRGVDLVVAGDVDSPLLGPRGAAHGFAPQKGADAATVLRLERSLTAFARACGRTPEDRSPAVALGAGAAGGLGFALLQLGGRTVRGIDWVLEQVAFGKKVAAADLVLTGEGSLDWQSLHGKTISGVSAAAMRHGVPVVVLAGQVSLSRREWMAGGVSAASAICGQDDHALAIKAAMAHGPERLADLAARTALTWSR